MTTLVTVTFEHESGMPEDQVVNTFHIGEGVDFVALTNPQITGVRDALEAFYTDDVAALGSIGELLGSQLSRTIAPMTLFYEGVVPPDNAGPPYGGLPFAVNLPAAAAGPNFPSEVAMVLSYKGDDISGVDKRRTRGRLFLGPLNAAAVLNDANDVPRISADTRTIVAGAAERLIDDLIAVTPGGVCLWVVFSRGPFKVGTPQVAATSVVTNGFIDDAFDTMRKRGEAASTRLLFAGP